MVDTTKVNAYVTALTNKFENKQANKKDDISGDFTNDSVSYPTVNAVKTWVNSVKTTLENAIALKVNISDIKDNLSSTDSDKPLSANQGKVLSEAISTSNTNLAVSISKQATAEEGYASTYVISQGGTALSPKINIEKDKMLRSVSIETVGATPTTEESNYDMVEGDQYILMVVNTVDNDGATNLILPIDDVFDLQSADENTLTLSASGVFSIKAGGVDTTELADSAITTAKINAKAVTKAKLADEVSAQWINDADGEIDAYLDAITAALTA